MVWHGMALRMAPMAFTPGETPSMLRAVSILENLAKRLNMRELVAMRRAGHGS